MLTKIQILKEGKCHRTLHLQYKKVLVKTTLQETTLEEVPRASPKGFWEEKCGIKYLGSTGKKGSTVEKNAGGKESREESVEGCGRKYAGGDLEQVQEDFGRGSAGQNIWEVWNRRKCRRNRKYGDVGRDTGKTKIVSGEIVMEAKAHKG